MYQDHARCNLQCVDTAHDMVLFTEQYAPTAIGLASGRTGMAAVSPSLFLVGLARYMGDGPCTERIWFELTNRAEALAYADALAHRFAVPLRGAEKRTKKGTGRLYIEVAPWTPYNKFYVVEQEGETGWVMVLPTGTELEYFPSLEAARAAYPHAEVTPDARWREAQQLLPKAPADGARPTNP